MQSWQSIEAIQSRELDHLNIVKTYAHTTVMIKVQHHEAVKLTSPMVALLRQRCDRDFMLDNEMSLLQFLPERFALQGCEMKRVTRSPGDGDDEDDLWGDTNGWGHDSDEETESAPAPGRADKDVSMETWIIMELCNRGSLRVGGPGMQPEV